MEALEDCGGAVGSCTESVSNGVHGGFSIAGGTDNNCGTNYHIGTGVVTTSWYLIDLGTSKDVQEINLWSRSDCCPNQASYTYVYIGDSTADVLDNARCSPGYMSFTYNNEHVTINCQLKGRYVYLWNSKPSNDYFSFADVSINGCTRCPVGYTTLGTGSTSIADCILDTWAATASCPVGSYSATGKSTYNEAYARLAQLLISSPPWGVYHAEDYASNAIPDSMGIRDPATSSGLTAGSGTGNGADGVVYHVSGTLNSRVNWPDGSVPPVFTLCTIARYSGSNKRRIFQGTAGNMIHGHWNNLVGVVHYGAWKTQAGYSFMYEYDWLVTCGNNMAAVPQNIKIYSPRDKNFQNIGTGVDGIGNFALRINSGDVGSETSDFWLSQVYIWEVGLESSEMDTVMQSMAWYLGTGQDLRSVESVFNPSIVKAFGCTACAGDYVTAAVGSTASSQCLGCPSGHYVLNAASKQCRRCPQMTKTTVTWATDVTQCVQYQPLVSYQFEDPNDLTYDSSGNLNHATVWQVYHTKSSRRGAGAAQFTNQDHYIKMNANIDIGGIQTATGITFSLWAYMDLSAVAHARIIDMGAGNPNSNILIYRPNSNNLLHFWAAEGTAAVATQAYTIPQNQWHHYVFSITSNTDAQPNAFMVWVDGVMICRACRIRSLGSIANVASRNWYIGKSNWGTADGTFVGLIDDFRFYNYVFNRFDVEQHYFPLYNPTGCPVNSYNTNPMSYHYPELVASRKFPGVVDRYWSASAPIASWDEAFRLLMSSNRYATIVRVCYDCAVTHWLIFYKRISPVYASWSVSQNMLYDWKQVNNSMGVDFKLYSTEYDYINDKNEWAYCNYDSLTGAFRDCGPTGAVGSQQVTTSGTNAVASKRVLFYLLKDCTSCAGDYVTGIANATSVSQCLGCAIGYYDNGLSQSKCNKCPGVSSTVAISVNTLADCKHFCSSVEYLQPYSVKLPEVWIDASIATTLYSNTNDANINVWYNMGTRYSTMNAFCTRGTSPKVVQNAIHGKAAISNVDAVGGYGLGVYRVTDKTCTVSTTALRRSKDMHFFMVGTRFDVNSGSWGQIFGLGFRDDLSFEQRGGCSLWQMQWQTNNYNVGCLGTCTSVPSTADSITNCLPNNQPFYAHLFAQCRREFKYLVMEIRNLTDGSLMWYAEKEHTNVGCWSLDETYLYLGLSDGNEKISMYFGEFLVYTQNMSNAEVNKVMDSLYNKWKPNAAASNTCVLCPLNSGSDGTAMNCTCINGYVSEYGAKTVKTMPCSKCDVGYYSSNPATITCAVCPDGKTTRKFGSASVSDCVYPNASCTSGLYYDTVALKCVQCPYTAPYSAMGSIGSGACSVCDAGKYWDGSSCLSCIASSQIAGDVAGVCQISNTIGIDSKRTTKSDRAYEFYYLRHTGGLKSSADIYTQYKLLIKQNVTMDVLFVGGGGPGATTDGGGGGAGGLLFAINQSIATGLYDVYVGAGGQATANGVCSSHGPSGSPTYLTDWARSRLVLRALGGGYAGMGYTSPFNGADGGSGGGAGSYSQFKTYPGKGLQSLEGDDLRYFGFGNSGGNDSNVKNTIGGGGGGGAGFVGGSQPYGNGGDGLCSVNSSYIYETPYDFYTHFRLDSISVGESYNGQVCFAGGGGGGHYTTGTQTTGGLGGGGKGKRESVAGPTAGLANTGGGGGGGGAGCSAGASGGSGVALLRVDKTCYNNQNSPVYDVFPNWFTVAPEGWVASSYTTQTCGKYGWIMGGYNAFAVGSYAQKTYTNLPQHNRLRLRVVLIKIDSWDGEWFYVYLDGTVVSSFSGGVATTGTGQCGQGSTWYEYSYYVDVEVAHYSSNATIRLYSTLDQGGTDESWGIQSMQVMLKGRCRACDINENYDPNKCRCPIGEGGALQKILDSTFESGTGNWTGSSLSTSYCTGIGTLLGGYNVYGVNAWAQVIIPDLLEHTSVILDIGFVKIDTWDPEEQYRIFVDGIVVDTLSPNPSNLGTANYCGAGTVDNLFEIKIEFEHTKRDLTLRIESTLDSAPSDESWGLAYARVYTKNDCFQCPDGWYSDSEAPGCIKCPALMYTNKTGASSLSDCKYCEIGYYSPNPPTVACIRCPHMTTTASKGATTVQQCIQYAPLVSYQFEDLSNLGKDSSGNGNHGQMCKATKTLENACASGLCTVTASSCYAAGYCTDSVLYGAPGSLYLSSGNVNEWVKIDLEKSQYIAYINFWAYACCLERTNGIQLWVGDDGTTYSNNFLCVQLSGYTGNNQLRQWIADCKGRYVWMINPNQYIGMQDIQFYGCNDMTTGTGRRGSNSAYLDANSNTFIAIPNNFNFFGLQAINGFTITCWFRVEGGDSYGRVFTFESSDLSKVWFLRNAGSGDTYFETRSATVGNLNHVYSGGVNSLWHHLVVTTYPSNHVDFPNRFEVWIDGVLTTEVYNNKIMQLSNTGRQKLLIGRRYEWFDQDITGNIDDFRIYNYTFNRFDVEQHYLPLYYPTTCHTHSYNPNGIYAFYPQLMASRLFPGVSNLNSAVSSPLSTWDDAFRLLVKNQRYGTIVRVCYDCAFTNWLVFYKRIMPVQSDWSISSNMLYNWFSYDNIIDVTFKIFSTEHDYINDINAWGFCNYDDAGVGAFRDCGQYGSLSNWVSTSRGILRFSFYLLQDCTRCPLGKKTLSNRSTSIADCTSYENESDTCPTGSYSKQGMQTYPDSYAGLRTLLKNKKPWGIYHAEDYNTATNTWPESNSFQPAATTTGTLTKGMEKGSVDTGNTQTVTFPYSGRIQTWTVPDGVTEIIAYLWGAGGGGGSYHSTLYGGGGGAFVRCTIRVTAGQFLYFLVGQGGIRGTGYEIAWTGGGDGNNVEGAGGGGGGLTGIFSSVNIVSSVTQTNSVPLVIAGSGGGSNGFYGGSGSTTDREHCAGGGGGNGAPWASGLGRDGGRTGSALKSGGGGGESAGGVAGVSAGSAAGAGGKFFGGNGAGSYGAGGGAGWFGGGGASWDGGILYGGGGGSSYWGHVDVSNVQHIPGSNGVVSNIGTAAIASVNFSIPSGIGNSGYNSNGQPGFIAIQFQQTTQSQITSISGTTTSAIVWPAGSIPTSFTLCTVSRWTGGANERVIAATTGNWLHGHVQVNRIGSAYYELWKTSDITSVSTRYTDWLVFCGNNGNQGAAGAQAAMAGDRQMTMRGVANGGTGGRTLTVNQHGLAGQQSNFAVSQVYIWNQILEPDDMNTAALALLYYVNTGLPIKTAEEGLTPANVLTVPTWQNLYAQMYSVLLKKKPISIYHAQDFDTSTGRMPDSTGNIGDAIYSGSGLSKVNTTGSGATASIPYIVGTTATRIDFPLNTIPASFTVCSITRYNAGTRNRILDGLTRNWLHGHHNGDRAVCFYEGWRTSSTTPISGNADDWIVMCGTNKNYGTPGNFKAAYGGYAVASNVGAATGGVGSESLTINWRGGGGGSDFAFSNVYIWDQFLTEPEMDIVANTFLAYLANGVSMKTMEYSFNPAGFVYRCSNCNTGLTTVSSGQIDSSKCVVVSYTPPLCRANTFSDNGRMYNLFQNRTYQPVVFRYYYSNSLFGQASNELGTDGQLTTFIAANTGSQNWVYWNFTYVTHFQHILIYGRDSPSHTRDNNIVVIVSNTTTSPPTGVQCGEAMTFTQAYDKKELNCDAYGIYLFVYQPGNNYINFAEILAFGCPPCPIGTFSGEGASRCSASYHCPSGTASKAVDVAYNLDTFQGDGGTACSVEGYLTSVPTTRISIGLRYMYCVLDNCAKIAQIRMRDAYIRPLDIRHASGDAFVVSNEMKVLAEGQFDHFYIANVDCIYHAIENQSWWTATLHYGACGQKGFKDQKDNDYGIYARFNGIMDMVLADDASILIADYDANNIKRIDLASTYVLAIYTSVCPSYGPMGVAQDSSRTYTAVACHASNTVNIFTAGGGSRSVATSGWAKAVSFLPNSELFLVAEQSANRVFRVNASDGTRSVWMGDSTSAFADSLTAGTGKIYNPTDVRMGYDGRSVYVVDYLNRRIRKGSMAACTECPAGTFAPGNGSLCLPCEPGRFSEAGSSTCYDCTPETCMRCKNNEYFDNREYACVACPAGKYAREGEAFQQDDCGVPQSCPEGFYGTGLVTRAWNVRRMSVSGVGFNRPVGVEIPENGDQVAYITERDGRRLILLNLTTWSARVLFTWINLLHEAETDAKNRYVYISTREQCCVIRYDMWNDNGSYETFAGKCGTCGVAYTGPTHRVNITFGEVYSIELGSRDKYLYVGSRDGSIFRIDIASGEATRTLYDAGCDLTALGVTYKHDFIYYQCMSGRFQLKRTDVLGSTMITVAGTLNTVGYADGFGTTATMDDPTTFTMCPNDACLIYNNDGQFMGGTWPSIRVLRFSDYYMYSIIPPTAGTVDAADGPIARVQPLWKLTFNHNFTSMYGISYNDAILRIWDVDSCTRCSIGSTSVPHENANITGCKHPCGTNYTMASGVCSACPTGTMSVMQKGSVDPSGCDLPSSCPANMYGNGNVTQAYNVRTLFYSGIGDNPYGVWVTKNYIYTCYAGPYINIHDVNTLRRVRAFTVTSRAYYTITVDPTEENIYVSEDNSHAIWKLNIATEVFEQFAGGGAADATGHRLTQARFNRPWGMAFISNGTKLLVGEVVNHRIKAIDLTTNQVSNMFYVASCNPHGFGVDPTEMYILVPCFSLYRVYKYTIATGAVVAVVGNGALATVDGYGLSAQIHYAMDIKILPNGKYAVLNQRDTYHNRLIRISDWYITTLTGASNSFKDSNIATEAFFYYPHRLGITANGSTVIVADRANARLRSFELDFCMSCPRGKFSKPGSTSVAYCMDNECGEGFWADSWSGLCQRCPVGTTSKEGVAKSIEDCYVPTACPANYFFPKFITVSIRPVPNHYSISGTWEDSVYYLTYLNDRPQTRYIITFDRPVIVDILIVAGGGGGGCDMAGGGGGGGVVYADSVKVAAGTYTAWVGAGGAGGNTGNGWYGYNGQDSSFLNATAYGGGGGGGWDWATAAWGRHGGSGGGGNGVGYTATLPMGGAGTRGQVNSSIILSYQLFGNPGGTGIDQMNGGSGWVGGGGGGGAGGKGENGSISTERGNIGGKGGVGIQVNIDGANRYWAGGGGGCSFNNLATTTGSGDGGLGGGGGGGRYSGTPVSVGGGQALNVGGNGGSGNGAGGGAGGFGTGGGGGAGCYDNGAGGAGGAGIIVIRVRCMHCGPRRVNDEITGTNIAPVKHTESCQSTTQCEAGYRDVGFTRIPISPVPNQLYLSGTWAESVYYLVHLNVGSSTQYTITFDRDVILDVLIVAGGGGGGYHIAGGGGGGGVIHATSVSIPAGTYTATVGDGGSGGTNAAGPGASGVASSIFGATAFGGGGGGGQWDAYTGGITGGSGGGGHAYATVGRNGTAGAGNFGTVSTSSPIYYIYKGYANAGGTGVHRPTGNSASAGGGGGAGTAGTAGSLTAVAPGGDGIRIDIDGNNYYWAAGGGGVLYYSTATSNGGLGGGGGSGARMSGSPYTCGQGGTGGINKGGVGTCTTAGSGALHGGAGGASTGSGGGGADYNTGVGGKGGSGIIVLKLSCVLCYTAPASTQTEVQKLHIFRFQGIGTQTYYTITVNQTLTVDIVIVAGGGGGGAFGGGGGGGGVLLATDFVLQPGTYPIFVGDGGTGSDSNGANGNNGYDSSFAHYISKGGGGGGTRQSNAVGRNGNAGGSGGGASHSNSGQYYGGASTQGSFTGFTKYGNAGGLGRPNTNGGAPNHASGGGGGAGGVGGNWDATLGGGPGGIGIDLSSIIGTSIGEDGYFAGGGGGDCHYNGGRPAPGGKGGGGTSGWDPGVIQFEGMAHTGGGGGGALWDGGNYGPGGGKGGSGIVVIKFKSMHDANLISRSEGTAEESCEPVLNAPNLYYDEDKDGYSRCPANEVSPKLKGESELSCATASLCPYNTYGDGDVTQFSDVSTLSGSGLAGYRDGPAEFARFNAPHNLMCGDSFVLVADSGNHVIRRVDLRTGWVYTLVGQTTPGFVNAIGTAAKFNFPIDVTVDRAERYAYVVDKDNHCIRVINMQTAEALTYAGLCTTAGTALGTSTVDTRFNDPRGLALDDTGNWLLVVDTNRMRKINIATGAVSLIIEVPITEVTMIPAGLDVFGDLVYVACKSHHSIKVINWKNPESCTDIAGNGTSGFVDAVGTDARFYNPTGVAVDFAGKNILVADSNDHTVRRIRIENMSVTTAVGSGPDYGYLDSSFANEALFHYVWGVAFTRQFDSVVVTDQQNNRIRRFRVNACQACPPSHVSDPYSPTLEFCSPNSFSVRPLVDLVDISNTVRYYIARNIDLSGYSLGLWLDASNTDGLYNAQGGVSYLSQWHDLSGNQRDFLPTVAATKCLWHPDGVFFDAICDMSTASSPLDNTNETIFVVFQETEVPNPALNRQLYSGYTSASALKTTLRYTADNTVTYARYDSTAATDLHTCTSDLVRSKSSVSPMMLTVRSYVSPDGVRSVRLYRNGFLLTAGATIQHTSGNTGPDGLMTIGEDFKGFIKEILVFPSDMRDVDVTAVHAYLQRKWGLSRAWMDSDMDGTADNLDITPFATLSLDCPQGFGPDGDVCEMCSAGTSSNGVLPCDFCAEGTYSTNGKLCRQCPQHMTSFKGSLRVDQCVCDNGYYPQGDVCIECPEGYYCQRVCV